MYYFKKGGIAITGIYMIKNEINQKVYIGQSKNIAYRWIRHRYDLNNNCHVNSHLQNSWNKYGSKKFTFKIIEECNIEDLNNREQYWILFYNSFKNGYNLDYGGQGVSGYKHTQEEVSKMRRIQSPLVILQFDTSFNFIERYEGGVSHIYKCLGYTKSSVAARCEHRAKNIAYKNSYWIYEDEYLSDNFSWKKYLNNIVCFSPKKQSKKIIQRKICQYDLQKNLIKTWDSYKELEASGFNRNQINTICNKRKNKKTHKGFIWAYEDYDFNDGYFDNINVFYNKGIEKRKRKVRQLNQDNVCIAIFNSIAEAAKSINVNNSCISRALKNHTNSGGYKWEYV